MADVSDNKALKIAATTSSMWQAMGLQLHEARSERQEMESLIAGLSITSLQAMENLYNSIRKKKMDQLQEGLINHLQQKFQQ